MASTATMLGIPALTTIQAFKLFLPHYCYLARFFSGRGCQSHAVVASHSVHFVEATAAGGELARTSEVHSSPPTLHHSLFLYLILITILRQIRFNTYDCPEITQWVSTANLSLGDQLGLNASCQSVGSRSPITYLQSPVKLPSKTSTSLASSPLPLTEKQRLKEC